MLDGLKRGAKKIYEIINLYIACWFHEMPQILVIRQRKISHPPGWEWPI